MNIWKVSANEGYNDAFLIDEHGEQRFEKICDFTMIQNNPFLRNLEIRTKEKGFPDVMNYYGIGGTIIVSKKLKSILEQNYENLNIQFLPCICSQYPNIDLWILNVCEYHNVLDMNNSIFRKTINLHNIEVIRSVKKYVFMNLAFDLDLFKIYLGNRKYATYLFISDRFKALMEDNNITGLMLEKVYTVNTL